MNQVKFPSLRLDSIDVFRAITMFLMIFVNDLWSLEGTFPDWLKHSKAAEDAMGLSDVVFPGFLFYSGTFPLFNRQPEAEREIAMRPFSDTSPNGHLRCC